MALPERISRADLDDLGPAFIDAGGAQRGRV
jgi:hypothetical protein